MYLTCDEDGCDTSTFYLRVELPELDAEAVCTECKTIHEIEGGL